MPTKVCYAVAPRCPACRAPVNVFALDRTDVCGGCGRELAADRGKNVLIAIVLAVLALVGISLLWQSIGVPFAMLISAAVAYSLGIRLMRFHMAGAGDAHASSGQLEAVCAEFTAAYFRFIDEIAAVVFAFYAVYVALAGEWRFAAVWATVLAVVLLPTPRAGKMCMKYVAAIVLFVAGSHYVGP